jgi:hypothetical protein
MARSGYRPGAPDAPEDGSGGPLRSPPTEGTSSDTLVLDSAGGFEIQVDSLECGGGAVELWVLTPVEEQLTDNACFTTDSLWTFPGPYDAETGVVLHVVPNFGNPPAQGAFQISGSFPTWTVDIEAGFDDDFNDVNLTVSWLEPQDTLVLSMTADTTELHPWIGQTSVNGRPQALRPGDTVQISVDGTVPGVDVEVSVELFPGGGHAHLTSRVPLTSVVLATNSSQIITDRVW